MKRFLIITAALLAALFSSCQKVSLGGDTEIDKEEQVGESGLSLSLIQEGEFTKAQDVVDVKDFYVKIYNGDELYKSFAKYSQVPSTIEMAPGTYKIEAGTQGQSKAAFSQPIFYGTTDVTVAPGTIMPVSLVCTLTNVKVTLLYTAEFKNAVNDNFEVAVSNGIDANLIFYKSHIDNNISGYFAVSPSLTITLQGYRRDNGKEVTHSITVDNVKARDHIVVKFDVEEIDNTGNVELGEGGITVDYKVNPKDEVIIIPGEGDGGNGDSGEEGGEGSGEEGGEGGEGSGDEEGDDSGDDNAAPLITGDGIGTPLYLTSDQANANPVVDINFKTLNGKTIKDVLVRIDSDSMTPEELTGMGLGGNFSIVNFEGEEGATRKGVLVELGLIDESISIKGTTSATFSIGDMMPLLFAISEEGKEHRFFITVIDSGDVSSSNVCVIVHK